MLPYVTEIDLKDGLKQLAEAGAKTLLTDRYNARSMIISQTLKAYQSWNPNINLEEVRGLLWNGDKYYHSLNSKISGLWKEKLGAVFETDLDVGYRRR